MAIEVYHFSGHTMGDTLMAMSLWSSLNEPVVLHTTLNSWYSKWKSILDIDDRITIHEYEYLPVDKRTHPNWLEGFKIFSRYVQTDHINLWGTTFKIGRPNKRCAAIFVSDGRVKDQAFFDLLEQDDIHEYPYYKFFNKQAYQGINDLVMRAGFEPIVIDDKSISLEHKTFILNELCEFAIGYEGGMTHLAHVLKVPTIIIPWHNTNRAHSNNSTEYHALQESWLHLDKKTYIAKNAKEVIDWDPEHLKFLVQDLHNDNGNNYWLKGSNFPSPDPLLEFLSGSHQGFHDQVAWAKQHITNPTIGGF
jgi:hypothetical protein